MYSTDNHWYEKLFDAVYQFVGILDDSGILVNANRAAQAVTGLKQTDMIGKHIWEIPWSGFSKINKRRLKMAVEQALQGEFVRAEFEVRTSRKPAQFFEFTLKPIRDENGSLSFVIMEGRDISASKKTSDALYESNVRFSAIFEKAGIGIILKGVDGKIIDCNPAFSQMLGYGIGELKELDYLAITHPDDRPVNKILFNELQDGKRESYNLEKRYLGKKGRIVWVSITATVVRGPEKKVQFSIVMAENITLQKNIEAELVEMRQRLTQERETERLKLAQELHDGPLQEIISISYRLVELEGHLKAKEGLELLQSIQAELQKASHSIRAVSSELRPSVLIPFGLEKAIISHRDEFYRAHPDLLVELELMEDGQVLDEQVRIALFRIYQEALNNIIRHANAKKVKVHFHFDDQQAVLQVKDDGEGFHVPKNWIELARKGHLGLVGSIERARDVGGRLEIVSEAGMGTQLQAIVPLGKEDFQNE
jgi:PAS domain S-box-containing protein